MLPQNLPNCGLDMDKSFRELSIHEIAHKLGPSRCQGLLFWHAFTGCDVTSSLLGIGKRTAWNVWNSMETEMSETFKFCTHEAISSGMQIDSIHMNRLENYVVKMYSKSSMSKTVNEARKTMFTQGIN
jgi:hypothetical protein